MAEDEEMSNLHFDAVSVLGSGKFGKVLKVLSKKDGQHYALKVIETETQDVTFAEVVKEVDFLQDLQHPNIVMIKDAVQLNGGDEKITRFGILMELCEQGDLRTFISKRKRRRFRSQTLQKWMLELSSAVGYIHSKSVMHRDLKPGNIFLDGKTSIKIGDFGVARNVLTSYAGTKVGTSLFMAPETFSGCYYIEADIYSLGCVFLCMAVAEKKPKISNGHFHPFPPKIAYGEKKLEIIGKCLENDKTLRPTASDIYQQLMKDDYVTLCFHHVRSANVNLAINPFTVYRDQSPKETGLAFSSRAIRTGEMFRLELKTSKEHQTAEISFGYTTTDPETLQKDVPTTSLKLAKCWECWIEEHRCEVKDGTKFCFWIEKNGKFMFGCDGVKQQSKMTIPGWRQLWAVFELPANVHQVQLIDPE